MKKYKQILKKSYNYATLELAMDRILGESCELPQLGQFAFEDRVKLNFEQILHNFRFNISKMEDI